MGVKEEGRYRKRITIHDISPQLFTNSCYDEW